jgi:hypothetical protein
MCSGAGLPGAGSDAGGLGQDVVTAVGDLAQLLDGFIQVAAFGGVPHRGAVKGAVEKLIRSGRRLTTRTLAAFTAPRAIDRVRITMVTGAVHLRPDAW